MWEARFKKFGTCITVKTQNVLKAVDSQSCESTKVPVNTSIKASLGKLP